MALGMLQAQPLRGTGICWGLAALSPQKAQEGFEALGMPNCSCQTKNSRLGQGLEQAGNREQAKQVARPAFIHSLISSLSPKIPTGNLR